ncbi:MAG: hypothetical protein KA035_01020 [Candidatus Levybacteria bacterium]|nr:hypothetical protein [Candidatus Levybacteria bacterium]
MKEQIQSAQLTRVRPYSTLEVPHSLRSVGIAMDSKPPEDNRAEINKIVAARLEGKVTADRAQAERILKDLLARRGVSVPESPDEMGARSSSMQAKAYERGAVAPERESSVAESSLIRSSMESGEKFAIDKARAVAEKYGTTLPEGMVPGSREFTLNQAPILPKDRQGYKYDAFNLADVDDNEIPETPEGPQAPTRNKFDTGKEINLNPADITHPVLSRYVAEINALNDTIDPREQAYRLPGLLADQYYEIDALPDDPNDPDFKRQKNMLTGRINTEILKMNARNERIGMYIQEDDKEQLIIDPLGWLDKKFDQLYRTAMSGQELDSPMLQTMQTLVSEAGQFLSRRFEKAFDAGEIESREKYEKFIDQFNKLYANRVSLLVARTTIDRKNMENVVGAYEKLRTEGLLGSMAFDNNKVGVMFNRILDYMETIRLKDGGDEQHITPIMMKRLQTDLEEEQVKLAQQGLGMFSDDFIRAKEKANMQVEKNGATDDLVKIADQNLRAEIRRAIRTGYDIAISSQQVALRSARGRQLTPMHERYSSDVIGAFGFLDIESFLIAKFGVLQAEQVEFLEYMKMDLATSEKFNDPHESADTLTRKQLLERGRRMFRDLDAAPDFFSSSWRIKKILQQAEAVTKYKLQNEEIVKELVEFLREENDPPGESPKDIFRKQLKKRFKIYTDTYLHSSKGKTLLKITGGEDKARVRIARDFAQGVLFTSIDDLSSPSGMTLEERNSYIETHDLDNAAINAKAAEITKNQGLFLRLRNPAASAAVLGEKDSVQDIWKRIQQYKPEEMMRVMRERLDPHDHKDKATLDQLNGIFRNAGGNYDKFKVKYGAILHAIREDAMLNGTGVPIDMRDLLKPEYAAQREQINKALGDNTAAQHLVEAFTNIDRFVNGNNVIHKLTHSWQYEDVYKRTLLVDDVPLAQLEYAAENSGIEKMSQIISGEVGGDALKRNGNDFMNYANASKFKVSILAKEGFESVEKDAEQFHQAVAQYEGPDGAARAFRYTLGTFMRFSLQDHWADLSQLGKLPFRWSSSDIERVFGPGQKPMTSEDARNKLDHVSSFLTGSKDEKDPHKAHYYYNQLEQMLRADAYQRTRDKIFTSSIYLLLIFMLIPAIGASKAVSEATH